MKNSFSRRMGMLGALLYGIIIFAIVAPFNPLAGMFLGVGALSTPFWSHKLPSGILGEGAPTPTGDPELALLEKVKKQMAIDFKALIDSSEDLKLIKELSEKIKNAKTDQELTGLKDQIKELGLKMEALKELPKQAKGSTMADLFVDAYRKALADGKIVGKRESPDQDVQLMISKGGWHKMEVKAATTMTDGNVTPSVVNAIPFTLAETEAGLTRIARANPFILQLVNLGRTIKKYVQWVEQANPDGGAGMTAEGAAKTQQDFDLVEKSKEVKKITSYIKVSKEMLDDVAFIESEIRTSLMELVALKMDSQVLAGDDTGNNLKGILEYAQAFSAGQFANAVDFANRFDVIRVAYNQIVIASGGDSNFAANFIPNYLVVHPTDQAFMELTKDENGQYILPPFLSASGMEIKGVKVIISPYMTQGDFLLGDFTKSNVKIREDATISVGLENDDFTKNLVTILCEMRGVHYIKSNHVNAFVTGTWSTAVAALRNSNS